MNLKINKRSQVSIVYSTALPVIFGVKRYADVLEAVCKKRDIQVNTKTLLVEVLYFHFLLLYILYCYSLLYAGAHICFVSMVLAVSKMLHNCDRRLTSDAFMNI